MLVLLMFGSFYMYLLYFRPHEYRNRKHVVFMVLLIVIFVTLTAITVRFDLFSVYIILTRYSPSWCAPLSTRVRALRQPLVHHLELPHGTLPFEFVIVQISAAMVSIFMLKELSERSQLIKAPSLSSSPISWSTYRW